MQTIAEHKAKTILRRNEATAAKAALIQVCLDQSDAELPSEPEDWQEAPSEEEQAQPSEDSHEDESISRAKRMRLHRKIDPANALAYPARPLLKQAEFKIRNAKLKLAREEQLKQFKNARSEALEPISAQPAIKQH